MNKKSLLFVPVLSLCLASCGSSQKGQEMEDLTQFVDPRIGTGGHGHVFYGANVPYGFIQLGPTSIPQSWDWVSGYHVSDSTVIGFPHTHLSGTGIGDLHDINVMPVVGEVTYSRGDASSYETGLWSYSDRSKEVVTPGYYRTHLSRYNVDVELTATKRVGFHKYTFLGNESPAIVFDMVNGGCWDKTTEAVIRVVNDSTVSGYRYSKGWADDQRVFFRAEFSRKFDNVEFIVNDSVKEGDMAKGAQLFARVNFAAGNQEPVYMKVALSPTSEEGAQLNMQTELSGWDFEKTIADAKAAWNKELNKVKVYTTDEASKKIFYTSLYHTLFAPSEFCDVNGDYYGADKQMHKGEGFVNYTTFSLWDTYRAAQPLMTILHPEKMSDIINTMLHIHQQQGKLPVWHLMGCETNCMVGNPGVPVVADAILKDIKGFDTELAFKALKESSMLPERGMEHRIEYGFIPADKMTEAIAYDMEYAIADWAVAQAAQKLGKQEDYEYFLKRSKSYKNYFDASTGFMRGKMLDGSWRTPFSPYASSHRDDDYCEGNAWQYTWLVPHDVEGLVECFGSKEAFVNKLDSLFLANGDMGEASSPDISGLIGQYAHGNEPSHHVAYLYACAGEPWKTQKYVAYIMNELYNDSSSGYAGNDDCGEMSAWYVFGALGFYPVNPVSGEYVIGTPMLEEAVIQLPGRKTFTVKAPRKEDNEVYICSMKLNGEKYTKNYITHQDIMKGGILEFVMTASPGK